MIRPASRRFPLACSLLLAASALVGRLPAARADDAVDIDKAINEAAKSLVIVEYTYRSENGSSEESGQGIVLNSDGLILIAGSLLPDGVPQEWVKNLHIRAAKNQFSSTPATFLGRSPNRVIALIKTDKPLDVPPLDLSHTGLYKLGEQIFAAAILSKGGAYQPYTNINHVRAILPMVHDLICTESFGLTRTNSPVYDAQTGALIGLTMPPLGESMSMSSEGGSLRVDLRDEDQTGVFLPIADLLTTLDSVKTDGKFPDKPFDLPRPWLGIEGGSGLDEDLRALYNIKEIAGITVGSVVPGKAADLAGIKPRDIIVGINGKPFSTTPVAEYMNFHFQRQLEGAKPGDKYTFNILRPSDGPGDPKKIDIEVTVGTFPKTGGEMPHTHNAKLGVTTRDLVFFDAYARKLPPETKGVYVALVKNGSPASLGNTPIRPGLIITKVNDTPIENEKQFDDALKDAVSPDKKEVVLVALDRRGETVVLRVDLTAEPPPDKSNGPGAPGE